MYPEQRTAVRLFTPEEAYHARWILVKRCPANSAGRRRSRLAQIGVHRHPLAHGLCASVDRCLEALVERFLIPDLTPTWVESDEHQRTVSVVNVLFFGPHGQLWTVVDRPAGESIFR
jgi:hypothetical protein